jgi:O-acetyl-ADP-ribose deacetylase (regulator of RNase III)
MGLPVKITERDNSLSLFIGDRKFNLFQGDVLDLEADALVCPVDQNLDFRSGLAKVICQAAGGKELRGERPVLPEPFGKVVVFPGGRLKVKFLFLAVILGEGQHDKLKMHIRHSVDRAIRYAEFLRLKSLAFPVLGCPKSNPAYSLVAKEMLEDVFQYFHRRNTKLKSIFLSAFNSEAYQTLKNQVKFLF